MQSPIAIYVGNYLPRSNTFIHRQLLGVAERHPVIVLAQHLQNRDLFPFSPIYHQPKTLVDNVSHWLYRKSTGRYIGLGLWQRRAWASVLREQGTRLIHAHFGTSGLQMLGLSQSLRLPLLVTFHGFDASRMLNSPRYVSGLSALFAYAHIITVSSAMRTRLLVLGASPDRTTYLPLGIPLDDFPFVERRSLRQKVLTDEAITFLQVAAFREKKGHFVTLRAFKKFLPSYPRSRLVFAGGGDLLPAAQSLAAELGISERVTFLGEVTQSNVRSLLAEADVFVHHSITADDGDQEGMPIAILEAMSTGLPVISSDHSGIPEVITNGENGHLVAERDLAAYADKMRAVLDDDGSLGSRAALTIRASQDITRQNAILSQLYEDIIAGEVANPDRRGHSRSI